MIIENSKLQSKTKRSVWLIVTMILWFAYVYLWLPLISLAAWWLGYSTFKYHMITLHGISGFKDLLITYALVITMLAGLLLCWAKLEHLRFKDKSRRNAIQPVSKLALATYFKQSEATLSLMQTKKVVVVKYNQEGKITELS